MHFLEAGLGDFEGILFPEIGVEEFEGDPLVVSFFDQHLEFGFEVDLSFSEHDTVRIFLLTGRDVRVGVVDVVVGDAIEGELADVVESGLGVPVVEGVEDGD